MLTYWVYVYSLQQVQIQYQQERRTVSNVHGFPQHVCNLLLMYDKITYQFCIVVAVVALHIIQGW